MHIFNLQETSLTFLFKTFLSRIWNRLLYFPFSCHSVRFSRLRLEFLFLSVLTGGQWEINSQKTKGRCSHRVSISASALKNSDQLVPNLFYPTTILRLFLWTRWNWIIELRLPHALLESVRTHNVNKMAYVRLQNIRSSAKTMIVNLILKDQ